MRRVRLPTLSRRTVTIALIVVLVLIVSCLAVTVFGRMGSAVKRAAFISEMTATKQAWNAQVTATTVPTEISTPEPTNTNTPIPTQTASVQIEEPVQLSTATSITTPSPTVGPSQTPERVIVSQSFANGLGEWQATDSSAVNIVNGSFYGTWLVLAMPSGVENYQIEIEGRASGTGTGVGIYVSPAFKSTEDNLYFRTNPIDREWRLCQGGSCQELSGLMRGVMDAEVNIVVSVVDQNVQVRINGVEVASVFNNQIDDATKVAIGAFGAGSSIRSVKVIQLP